MPLQRDAICELIRELVLATGPPGREAGIDAAIRDRLSPTGLPVEADAAGNLVVRLAGREPAPLVALAAHKDEIAAVVKRIEDDGRVRLIGVGDAHPWVWGEAPLALLGDAAEVPAVLSFGSRHVSEESPQRAQLGDDPVRWRDVWAETKCTPHDLAVAGVRAGTRAVLRAERREPLRLGAAGEYISSPALDDRAAVAVLLLLASRLERPRCNVDLVFTSREEVGCQGASWYARHSEVDAFVSVEVCPVAPEYGVTAGPHVVLIEGDASSLMHHGLSRELHDAARRVEAPVQHALLDRYGCEASHVYRSGLAPRAAAIALATDNTHGQEIVHLDAVEACARVLAEWLV
jgi:putative aminopeptidase FrvX